MNKRQRKKQAKKFQALLAAHPEILQEAWQRACTETVVKIVQEATAQSQRIFEDIAETLYRAVLAMRESDPIPDDTALPLDEWNRRVDALLAECAGRAQEQP